MEVEDGYDEAGQWHLACKFMTMHLMTKAGKYANHGPDRAQVPSLLEPGLQHRDRRERGDRGQ